MTCNTAGCAIRDEFIACYKRRAKRVPYPNERPGKIIGVGRNYKEHAAELNNVLPTEPLLFFKPGTAIIGAGQPIVRPRGDWRVDFEGELGVVIGKTCRRVSRKDALSFVAGYTIVNDVTVRDLQKKDGQFTRAKGFDSFCPCGPFLVDDLDP